MLALALVSLSELRLERQLASCPGLGELDPAFFHRPGNSEEQLVLRLVSVLDTRLRRLWTG